MKHAHKITDRLLSWLLALALLTAVLPAAAEEPATPSDLQPVPAQTEDTVPQDAGEEPVPPADLIPEEEPEAGPVETEYPAFLPAATELFADEALRLKTETLAEKAVVLVLSAGEQSVRIAYVFLNESGEPAAAEAYVRAADPRPLTEEERAAWENAFHPVAAAVRGIPLEPVIFSETEPETLPEIQPADPAEATPTDLEAGDAEETPGEIPDGIPAETPEEAPEAPAPAAGRLNVSENPETYEDWTEGAAEEEDTSVLTDPVIFSMADGTLQAAISSSYINTNVPAIRNQGTWGACWAFAIVGALEIDLIKGNMATTSVDLSELFLAFFTAHNYPYAKGGVDGDDITSTGQYLDIGGNNVMGYRILANLIGTVNETSAPYNPSGEPEMPTAYTAVTAQLNGAYLIDPSNRNAVKQAILDHGAVGASIDSNHETQNGYMYGTGTATNHDVLLIGWDDNISTSSFKTPPPGPGAWKIRNSWGNTSQNYWVSYYDGALLSTSATAYDASNKDISDFCYSFDKTPYPGGYIGDKNKVTVRQTYTVDGNETLQAIGVETGTDRLNVSVSVKIGGTQVASGSVKASNRGFYRVPLNPAYSVTSRTEVELTVTMEAMDAGTVVYVPYEKIGNQTLSGELGSYHYTADSGSGGFYFNEELKLGDARLKIYTKKNKTSGPSAITLSASQLSMKSGEEKKLTATISPASETVSLLWYTSDKAAAAVEQDGTVIGGPDGGTAIITAIAPNGIYATCKVTVQKVIVNVQKVEITGYNGAKAYTINDDNAGDFKIGSILRIESALTPKYPTSYSVAWKSSNPDMMAVVDHVNNSCDFKVLKNGTSQITVTVTDNLTKKTYSDYINITVYLPVHVTSVSVAPSEASVWEGDTTPLEAKVLPGNAENQKLIWKSSNTAIATVDGKGLVKGIKDGTAVITATSEDRGFSSSCTVTVKTKDLVEAFVYRMYRICLLREPDPAGFADWVKALKSGERNGAEIAQGFYYSNEMRNRGLTNEEFATRAYEGLLGRTPDAAGLADWASRLDQGVSYLYIIAGFTNSQEFTEICGTYGIERGTYESPLPRDMNLGITGFVSRLYTKMLGRGYDEDGLNTWCTVILKDPTKTTAYNVALDGFLHSSEFLNKQLSDVDFVKVLYRTFLGREYDEPGLRDWVSRLAAGQSRDEVAAGFAYSAEFSEIMAQYGLK